MNKGVKNNFESKLNFEPNCEFDLEKFFLPNEGETEENIKQRLAIKKKKDEYRREKKKEQFTVYKEADKTRTLSRKKADFQEISQGGMDALQLINARGHLPRGGNGVHPNKARKERQKAAKAERIALLQVTRKIKTESGISSTEEELTKILTTIFLPFMEIKKISSVLGPFSAFVYQLYRARNSVDMGVAAFQYISAMGLDPISQCKKMYDNFVMNCTIFQTNIISESWSENIYSAKSFLCQIVRSDFAMTIRNLVLGIVSLKWFSKDIALQVYAYLGNPPKMDMLSLFELLVEQMISLLKFGEMLVSGVSPSDILMASDPLSSYLKEVPSLLYYKDKLYTGLPVEGKMCLRSFILDSKKLLADGELILKRISPLKYGYGEGTRLQLQLREAHFVASKLLKQEMRPAPCGILLHGDPNIGKSRLLPFIADIYSNVKGRVFDDSHIFHRSITSQYWEGYDPDSHPIIHYSEIGNVSAKIAMSQGDPIVTELTSLIDSMPFPVDMAFDDKGKVFACPELVMADTNSPDLNLEYIVKNPAAYKRRFLYIEPKVKGEFRIVGGCGMDKNKSLSSELPPMDRWLFNVSYYNVSGIKQATVVSLMTGAEDDDIYKFVRVMREYFTDFVSTQTKINELMKDACRSKIYDDSKEDALPIVVENGVIPRRNHFRERTVIYTEYAKRLTCAVFNFFLYNLLYMCCNVTMEGLWIRKSISIFFFLISIWTSFSYTGMALLPFAVLFPLYVFQSPHTTLLILGAYGVGTEEKRKYAYSYLRYLLGGEFGFQYVASSWWQIYGNRLTIAVASFSAIILLYRLFSSTKKIQYVNTEAFSDFYLQSDKNKPLNDLEEEMECGNSYSRIPIRNTNIWNSKVTLSSKCAFNGNLQDLSKLVERNTRLVYIDTDREVKNFILGIKSNMCIINTHALGSKPNPIIRVSTIGSVSHNNTVFIDTVLDHSNRCDIGNDITVIMLSGIKFKNIEGHLSNIDYSFPRYEGIFRNELLQSTYENFNHTLIDHSGNLNVGGLWVYSFPDHYAGACGLPLLIQKNSGCCIVGIHAGGAHNLGYASPLHKDMIVDAMNKLQADSPLMNIYSEGGSIVGPMLEPSFKSPFFYEIFHGLRYYGRLAGPIIMNQKSRVVKSRFFCEMQDIFKQDLEFIPKTQFGPPLMQPCTRNGVYLNPYNIALRKMADQRSSLDMLVLEKVITRYTKFVLNGIKKTPELSPLTIASAINGVDIDPFIRRINVTTAGGSGFGGKKEDYLPIVFQDELHLVREPIDVLKSKLELIMQIYSDQETCDFIYKACLKDEARDNIKNMAGKTRVFYSSPLDGLIIARMMLSPFYSLMVENNDAFCCSVGINMHAEAGLLVEKLTGFSPLLMEGDYSNYDQSMPFDIGWAAASIVENVLASKGYNNSALIKVRGVLTDSLFPYVNMNNDLMEIPGLQPSGKYATAEDNSLRGIVMLMYFWYSHKNLKDLDFFEYVLPVVYGDDMLASVKPEVAEYMNNIEYAAFCKSKYNLGFTPAFKAGKFEKFLDIHSVSYLKRKFVYRYDISMWVAQLDIDSILKSMIWIIPSGSVTSAEQMLSTIQSALWELFFHMEELEFETMRNHLIAAYSQHYVEIGDSKFPTFRSILGSLRGEL